MAYRNPWRTCLYIHATDWQYRAATFRCHVATVVLQACLYLPQWWLSTRGTPWFCYGCRLCDMHELVQCFSLNIYWKRLGTVGARSVKVFQPKGFTFYNLTLHAQLSGQNKLSQVLSVELYKTPYADCCLPSIHVPRYLFYPDGLFNWAGAIDMARLIGNQSPAQSWPRRQSRWVPMWSKRNSFIAWVHCKFYFKKRGNSADWIALMYRDVCSFVYRQNNWR